MVIRGIKLTPKQPAAIEPTRQDHSTDAMLQFHYIGISKLRKFACGDYLNDLLRMDII